MQVTGWISTCSGVKLEHYPPPCIGINSKQFTFLSLEHETLKVIEEHTQQLSRHWGRQELTAENANVTQISLRNQKMVPHKMKTQMWKRKKYFVEQGKL